MDHTTHETADEIVERLLAVVSGLANRANQPGVTADALRTLADEASEALRTIARPPSDAPLFAQADALAAELLSDFDNRQAAAAAWRGCRRAERHQLPRRDAQRRLVAVTEQ